MGGSIFEVSKRNNKEKLSDEIEATSVKTNFQGNILPVSWDTFVFSSLIAPDEHILAISQSPHWEYDLLATSRLNYTF